LLLGNYTVGTVESTLKYFLVNGLGTLLKVFGFSLLFFYSKTYNFDLIYYGVIRYAYISFSLWPKFIYDLGVFFIMLGFLVKLGVAPFHY